MTRLSALEAAHVVDVVVRDGSFVAATCSGCGRVKRPVRDVMADDEELCADCRAGADDAVAVGALRPHDADAEPEHVGPVAERVLGERGFVVVKLGDRKRSPTRKGGCP